MLDTWVGLSSAAVLGIFVHALLKLLCSLLALGK